MIKKGGYSKHRLNYLKHCKNVINIVNTHYKEGYTTYAGVFRTFVEPFYPMHYNTFMKIVNMPNIDKQIEREKERIDNSAETDIDSINQPTLFD